jgi:AraC-like DNA-binding protein
MNHDALVRSPTHVKYLFRDAARAEEAHFSMFGSKVEISGKNPSEFLYEFDFRGDQSLCMFDARARNGGKGVYSVPDNKIGMTVARRGHGRVMTSRDEFDIGKNYGLIFQTTHLLGYEIAQMARWQTVLVQRADFDRLINRHFERDLPLVLEGLYRFSLNSRLGPIFNMASLLLAENHASEPGFVYSEWSIRLIREALIVSLAELIVSKTAEEPLARATSVSKSYVRAALDIIKTQEAPLTIHDVAEAVGIGVRALQIGFQAHLGMSPHALLKQGRIEGAHRDLASGAAQTVAAAARKWGFSNVGRFAGEYFKVVGEYPSDTVQRGRT